MNQVHTLGAHFYSSNLCYRIRLMIFDCGCVAQGTDTSTGTGPRTYVTGWTRIILIWMLKWAAENRVKTVQSFFFFTRKAALGGVQIEVNHFLAAKPHYANRNNWPFDMNDNSFRIQALQNINKSGIRIRIRCKIFTKHIIIIQFRFGHVHSNAKTVWR